MELAKINGAKKGQREKKGRDRRRVIGTVS